ncbi:MAG TPA: ABC transporter substrate-binding protein [Telmatospirillum sp.]|nr:ABC transporter substrate-binding protein [Telmatospirillum sp.]
MRTRHLVYALTVLLLGSLSSPSHATDPAANQSAFVSDLARNAILSVASETISPADRQQRLKGFLDKDFDMPRIATFVLGRYWQKASAAERQTFTTVYSDFMVRVYSQRFARYNGESFRIIGQSPEGATSTVVYTEMNQPASGPPLKVEWHVAGSDGYRVTDISIVGVSMALAQRDDFSSFLQQNGGNLSALIQKLQVKTVAMDAR